MADIYRRLARAGFDRKFLLSAALPAAWADERANEAAGREDAEAHLAHALQIDAAALADPKGDLALSDLQGLTALRPADTDWPAARAAVFLARRLAQLAVRARKKDSQPWLRELDAEQLREWVVQRHRVVQFSTLVQSCWSLGVPVLCMSGCPQGVARRGVDAMAISVGDVPVIVLAGRLPAPAWMLWPLAHQIGHIASGHLDYGDTVDADLWTWSRDPLDVEAQSYADALIGGGAEFVLKGHDRVTGVKLARLARERGRELGLGVGALVTRFALDKAFSGRDARGPAKRALRELGVEKGGRLIVKSEYERQLDLRKLDPVEQRFFSHLTGLDEPA